MRPFLWIALAVSLSGCGGQEPPASAAAALTLSPDAHAACQQLALCMSVHGVARGPSPSDLCPSTIRGCDNLSPDATPCRHAPALADLPSLCRACCAQP